MFKRIFRSMKRRPKRWLVTTAIIVGLCAICQYDENRVIEFNNKINSFLAENKPLPQEIKQRICYEMDMTALDIYKKFYPRKFMREEALLCIDVLATEDMPLKECQEEVYAYTDQTVAQPLRGNIQFKEPRYIRCDTSIRIAIDIKHERKIPMSYIIDAKKFASIVGITSNDKKSSIVAITEEGHNYYTQIDWVARQDR